MKTKHFIFIHNSQNYCIDIRSHLKNLNRFKADYLTISREFFLVCFTHTHKKDGSLNLSQRKKNLCVMRDKKNSMRHATIEPSNKYRNAHNVAIIWLRLAYWSAHFSIEHFFLFHSFRSLNVVPFFVFVRSILWFR